MRFVECLTKPLGDTCQEIQHSYGTPAKRQQHCCQKTTVLLQNICQETTALPHDTHQQNDGILELPVLPNENGP